MKDMIVNLEYPITQGEVTFDKLVFKGRPTVAHMMAGDPYERGTHEYELAVMSALTGVPEIALRKLDYADYIHAEAIMAQRFPAFLDQEIEESYREDSADPM